MTLISVYDPALLIYKYEDWTMWKLHCFNRFATLTLHRRITRKYEQKIALSARLIGLIYQSFPWNENYRYINELRDLRLFILDDLSKATYIDVIGDGIVELQPHGIIGCHVDDPEIIDAWEGLLCGCVDEALLVDFESQIATWETTSPPAQNITLTITSNDSESEEIIKTYHLPLVWDEDSWANQLVGQNWWPDLERCVELHFRTNTGMMAYPEVREHPIPFECTNSFWASVERYCIDENLRHLLIKAVTKKVYGIQDASLGDESLGELRRFRVTDFWRIHYREETDQLTLEEFGPHDIGGVN